MPEPLVETLVTVARLFEVIGAAALVLGFLVASVRCVRQSYNVGRKQAIARYRQDLGRSVLIGLEILVAATIIKTITLDKTFDNMSFLAIMLAIRTTLGWTMVLEMNGRWPWQKPEAKTAEAAP